MWGCAASCHSPSLTQGMFVWAFNGVGLGLLLPNAQVWGAGWAVWRMWGVHTGTGGTEVSLPCRGLTTAPCFTLHLLLCRA